MPAYDFKTIERKWQERWEKDRAFYVAEDSGKPKFMCVNMYPYPSGDLHQGHVRNYTYGDLLTRYKRMRGFNVMSPMGWDSFGLPAENAAIETGIHPSVHAVERIARMTEQIRRLGAVYDWDREVAAHSPDYYRWTQWLFLRFFEKGLAYKAKAPVNWCPNDQTVLANEQVVGDGVCERCGTPVEKRDLEQWFLKITDYAQRLLDDLVQVTEWPERVRVMQENWIGRSEGAEFDMQIAGHPGEKITVYTTRPDTSFGMTFVVLAPEHPLVAELIAGGEQEAEAQVYIETARRESEIQRLAAERDKTGVFIGAHATNPVNGREVPIFIADYVLMGYGTGAIMAVPGEDQRDWEFAERYGLDIIRTVQPPDGWEGQAYTGDGPSINSGFLDGLYMEEAKRAIIEWFEEQDIGRGTVRYRLRDWLISRQRYWGCPIPIVSCDTCGLVAVPEEQLPVLLPDIDDYTPKGRSPLAAVPDFVDTTCPNCEGPARRETDTMDTFVDSSWYFLRYTDARNTEVPFDPAKANYWMPLDQYIGGIEHAVLHLMYARFFTKVLHDLGMVEVQEPFARLFTQGMITLGGAKMSKSKRNVVDPVPLFDSHGADSLRLYHLFMGPPTDDAEWSDRGVDGTFRFLERVWRLGTGEFGTVTERAETEADVEMLRTAHRTIKKVTEDIDRFAFNTAVAALMSYVNSLYAYVQTAEGGRTATFAAAFGYLLLLLSPMAPHLAHELWERQDHTEPLYAQPWPAWDPDLVAEETVTMVVQVNGKVRDRLEVPADIGEEAAREAALASEKIARWTEGEEVRTVIARPPKLVNIVVG